MLIAFFLLHAILSGILSAYISSEKGYSTVSWFFIGLLFGVFGLISAAGLPDKILRKECADAYKKHIFLQSGNDSQDINMSSSRLNSSDAHVTISKSQTATTNLEKRNIESGSDIMGEQITFPWLRFIVLLGIVIFIIFIILVWPR